MEAIRLAIVETIDAAVVGRRVLPVDPSPTPTAEYFVYYTRTHMSDAAIIGRGDTIPRDSAKLARTRAQILKLAKGFEITKEDLATSGRIRDVNARSAARQIMELENDFIWNSADEPDVDGCIDDAGNTNAGVAAWSGGIGVAFPLVDTMVAMANLLADGFAGPYDMVIEAVNFGEAAFRQANLEKTELECIRTTPNIRNIYIDAHVPHATAILMQPGPEFAVLAEAQGLEIEGPFYDPDTQVWKFNLTERVCPAIMQPNSINSITGL